MRSQFARSCAGCTFWEPSPESRNMGWCRYESPRSIVMSPPQSYREIWRAFWPLTSDTDWCGQFKPGPERAEGWEGYPPDKGTLECAVCSKTNHQVTVYPDRLAPKGLGVCQDCVTRIQEMDRDGQT